MTLIAMPTTPGLGPVSWTPPAATQVNRSPWNAKRRVTKLPDGSFWRARITLPTIASEAEMMPWRRFLMALEGRANTFRLVAPNFPQTTEIAVRSNGGGQTGIAIAVDGIVGGGTILPEGAFVTIADQLLVLSEPLVAVGGAGTLHLTRRVRKAVPDNLLIEVRLPWALMALAVDDANWLDDVADLHGLSLDAEEDVA